MASKKRTPRLGRGLSSLMAKPVDVKPPKKEAPEVQDGVEKDDAVAVAVAEEAENVEQETLQEDRVAIHGAVDFEEKSAPRETSVEVAEEQQEEDDDNDSLKLVSAEELIVEETVVEAAAETLAATASGEKVEEVVENKVEGEVVDEPHAVIEAVAEAISDTGLRYINVEEIVANRYQPRQEFDEAPLRALSESIKNEGLMQPIIVRTVGDEAAEGKKYELVAGERRWRAAQMAGLETIPGFVRELDDKQMAEWALIENLQREDLNPIERAEAFKRLAETFELSHEQVAERVGVERSTVSNHLRLLKLGDEVRGMLRAGELSMGQARSLAGISDPQVQLLMAKKAIAEAWSVRRMEMEVRKLAKGENVVSEEEEAAREEARVKKAAYMADLENHLAEQLSTKIKIRPGRKKGSGTLSIEFYSLDQFDDLLSRMGVRFE